MERATLRALEPGLLIHDFFSYSMLNYFCFTDMVLDSNVMYHKEGMDALDVFLKKCILLPDFKKVKSSMARSLPVENLLPQNVGSIINYLQ